MINTSVENNTFIIEINSDKSVNTFDSKLLGFLDALIDTINTREDISSVVFTSSKPGCFVNGADLNEMGSMNSEEIAKFIEKGQSVFHKIFLLNKTTVAALNGHAMGGGFEIALACDYRIAADDGSINIGLPESKLGILPAWGGTTRMVNLIGLAKALPLILAGKVMSPRKAQKEGLIDEVVRPEALLLAAKRWAQKEKPNRALKGMAFHLTNNSLLRKYVLNSAKKETRKQTRGNYPAADEIIRVAEIAAINPEQGLEAEKEAVLKLEQTPACKNLMNLFFLKNKAKKVWKEGLNSSPLSVTHAAVIGGGVMGAGICAALISSGIKVRLIEMNEQAASAAIGRVYNDVISLMYSKKKSQLEVDQIMNLLSVSTEWTGLGVADFVVEAVAERLDVKHDVFRKLDQLTKPEAILATNTSSLNLSDIAKVVKDPSRVIGLHFFNPVAKMPLVEVVRFAESSDTAIATGAALAFSLGKVGVVVNDGPGFLVNRLLIPYLAEALSLLGDGYWDIEKIDKLMLDWGMPMGPFTLMDQIGLDIVTHIFESLNGRMDLPISSVDNGLLPHIDGFLEGVNKYGFKGKKSGAGFYKYKGKKKKVNKEMISLMCDRLGILPREKKAKTASNEWIEMRLMLPMIHEMTRIFEDKIISDTDIVDLSTVLGLGLAPFRGGLARFATDLGSEAIAEWSRKLSKCCGYRFQPPILEIGENNKDLSNK